MTVPEGTPTGWRPTAALRRAVLVTCLSAAAGVVLGRPDLVALVAPLAVGTVLAMAGRRVPAPPTARAEVPGTANQGDALAVHVTVDAGPGIQLAVVRLPDGPDVPHGRTVAVAVPSDSGRRRLEARALTTSWGAVTVARPDLLVAGPDALHAHGPVAGAERRTRVLPAVSPVPPAPLPARPAGLVGAHRTRRPGEGSDLLDVREFVAGDRIRRIDWRVSARTGRLHVRRTASDVDADVVLCLDTRLDVGPRVQEWTSPPGPGPRGAALAGSSLDVAVRAAASLAAAHLREGDRVSVVDLSRPRLSLPPGTGLRQLRRIRRRLTDVGVHSESRRLALRPGTVPASSVVVVLSPLLDEAVADLVATLHRRGGEVVALDVLPDPLVGPDSGTGRLALRLVLAERADRLRALARHGVLVLRWDPATFGALMARRARDRGRRAS